MSSQIILTTEVQLEAIVEKLLLKFNSEKIATPVEAPNELLNVTDAAKFLGIARQTLYGYTSKRVIPFIKRGGKKITFRRTDLLNWLEEGQKASISELKRALDENEK